MEIFMLFPALSHLIQGTLTVLILCTEHCGFEHPLLQCGDSYWVTGWTTASERPDTKWPPIFSRKRALPDEGWSMLLRRPLVSCAHPGLSLNTWNCFLAYLPAPHCKLCEGSMRFLPLLCTQLSTIVPRQQQSPINICWVNELLNKWMKEWVNRFLYSFFEFSSLLFMVLIWSSFALLLCTH